jgi:hypothetical protein
MNEHGGVLPACQSAALRLRLCSGLIWVFAAALIRGRLKWSGKYEAHLWDNTSQVKGRKRKGKHGMRATNLESEL